jgi:hypothetical protein
MSSHPNSNCSGDGRPILRARALPGALRVIYAEPPSDVEIDRAKLAGTFTISELPPDNDLDVEDVVHVPMLLAVDLPEVGTCGRTSDTKPAPEEPG